MVAADGSAAGHSGDHCIPAAAHHVGDGVAIQGNILASDHVVPDMVAAWAGSSGALAELRRLLALRRANDLLERADEMLATGDLDGAVDAYGRAVDLAPDEAELRFWAAVSLFTAGAQDAARGRFAELVAHEPHWRDVLARIDASGLFPGDLGGLAR